MAYEYDVFLSYVRDRPFGDWVHEHFLPFFEPYLRNSLSQPPTIFTDTKGIRPGDEWPQRLKRALARSRCLVAVWLPCYFRSTWCRYECAAMLHRERQLGYRTTANPQGLILPVTIYDGERFPSFTKGIQCLDCTKYARVGYGFSKTERYVEFQDCLAEWVEGVAQAVTSAPLWKEEWQEESWFAEAITKMGEVPTYKFDRPALE